ncbi:MAG: type II toxin-antitoxin system VapC family toxin [Intrasporangiaceae bacterium]|nr:type II toxin-antitoxin system VapC family toxin [Intrasporangiaceae bacterium]
MIVVDASALGEALVGRDPDPALLDAMSGEVSAPDHLHVEVLSALRGLVLGHKLGAAAAEVARRDLFALSVNRFDLGPLADRAWELKDRFTTYDAAYIALAEALECPLLTCDAKLRAGHRADVRVVSSTG